MSAAIFLSIALLFPQSDEAGSDTQRWVVPAAGNIFRTAPSPDNRARLPEDGVRWSNANEVYSLFFHVCQPSRLKLSLEAASSDGLLPIEVAVSGKISTHVIGKDDEEALLGHYDIESEGYVRVDFAILNLVNVDELVLKNLIIESETEGLDVSFVRTNEGQMFYWGRRGPSVHLRYQVPSGVDIRYAFSEIVVPSGNDVIGSFYMANGFGEGYFGFQVNSPTERRVLFSVWSPFTTDDPREIPEDQRVVSLARGEGVHVGEFGNEGSGGQSFLVYPWQTDVAYRFLTEVVPDGEGSSIYTSWFSQAGSDEWLLIASFRRPQTDTHLVRFHSFLESFHPAYGHIQREAMYQNVWVKDVEGNWHECTSARFTTDATGSGRHRLDYAGGTTGSAFFLRNCGFFNESTTPGSEFRKESSGSTGPGVDTSSLPRN